ncbi:BTAD domain-containing putative transcriptional regulator [Streptomyces sp. NPDC050211]|uniref:AfsR/SARP family transcriptional regulator n=1 Tax=Streptomyces sp. NPDC050211 TaxID=3154932 RepID=UPI00342A6DF2
MAPVVRALRLAYDEASRPDERDFPDVPDWSAESRPAHSEASGSASEATSTSPDVPWDDRAIGVKDGQALAWDLAQAHGLGLVGPGAHDAARALLVSLLARQHEPSARSIRVVVPAADWRLLIGECAGDSPQLHVAGDLVAALDWVESELLTRVRNHIQTATRPDSPSSPHADLVLVATPAPHADSRLQAIFDNGSAFGLAGILLGQWRPGVTVGIAPNGIVTTASPSAPDAFGAARLFTLPADDAQVLIDLLVEAQPAAGLPPIQLSESTSAAHDEERGVPSRALGTSPPSTSGDDSGQPSRLQCATGQVPVSSKPLQLIVLGSSCLIHRQGAGEQTIDITSALAPKQRELLVYLALHREGARRESIVAAIWPGAPQDRPYNSFHATLSQLRRALRTATQGAISDVTTHVDGRYALDDAQVTVDLWHLRDALDASRPGVGVQSQHSALERVVELYSGDLADDVGAEWIEAPREAIRRDVMDAVSALVRLLREREPGKALSLLEYVRTFDPFNEAIYRDIARFQAHLGHQDAVARTFKLLETTLAEIDEEPSPETVALLGSLQRVHPPRRGESDSTT